MIILRFLVQPFCYAKILDQWYKPDIDKTKAELVAELASIKEKYERLESDSYELYKRAKKNENELEQIDKMKKPKPLSVLAKHRIKLTNFYLKERSGIVDKGFFEDWGNFSCYRLISGSLFQKGAVGILGKNNMEHKYGHVKRALSDREIKSLNLRIIKSTNKSITITGEGLVQDVVMIYRTAPVSKRKKVKGTSKASIKIRAPNDKNLWKVTITHTFIL